MTPSEIERMRKERPDEFIGFVGELIHGYVWAESPFCGPILWRKAWQITPDSKLIPRPADFVGSRAMVHKVPRYDADPAADYATLKHVRETWADREKRLFVNRLYPQRCLAVVAGQVHHLASHVGPSREVARLDFVVSAAALSVVTGDSAAK